ncbi:MAG: DinB family protein, partial [Acidobacteria bacterium]|nr:DinB family protein [Acidobacteriota bacterium]
MKKQALLGQYQYFKMVHGVTLRLIGTFEDKDLDYRPKPGMRSVRELIMHIYGMMKTFSEGMKAGKLTADIENQAIPETTEGKAGMEALKTVADLQAFARNCFQTFNDTLEASTDEQLVQPLESPFGTFPTWQYFSFGYDEHWHHRGQLYVYARLLGKEPPML